MGHDGPGHLAIADGRPVRARAQALPRQVGRRPVGRDEGAARAGDDPRRDADRRRPPEAARRRGRVDRRPDVPDRQHELAHPLRVEARPRSWTPGAPKARRTTSRSASVTSSRGSARSPNCSGSSSRSSTRATAPRHTLPVDAGQIDELRRWGQNLSEDGSHPELQPAGRAILLLIDEIERLREQTRPDEPPSEDGDGRPETAPDPDPGPRPTPTRRKRGFFHRYRRLAIGLAVLGALVFATLALGARLSAPGLDPQGPCGECGRRPGQAALALLLGGRRPVRARPRPLEAGRHRRHRQGVHEGRPLRVRREPPSRRKPSHSGDRAGRLPRLPLDEVVERARGHARPDDLVRPAGRDDPVRSTRSPCAGTLEPGATLTANGRPVLVSSNGRFRLSWAKRPTGPISLVATDTLRNASDAPRLDLDAAAAARPSGSRRPRHRRRLGRPGVAQGHRRPDRPGPDQRRRARPEGRGRARSAGTRRCRSRTAVGAVQPIVRPAGGGRVAARERRARDRPARLLPRPDPAPAPRGGPAGATR